MMPELFNGKSFDSYHEEIKYEIKREIEGCDKEYISKIETDKYSDYLISKYSIQPISISMEQKELLEPQETETRDRNMFGESIIAPATRYTLVIPFDGNSNYFYYRPNPYIITRHKEGIVIRNELHISFTISDYSRTTLKREIEEVIEDIEYHINSINKNVEEFNNTLGYFIKPLVEKRKKKLATVNSVMSGLEIPIRARNRPVSPLKIPIEKKEIKLKRPKVPKTESKPYWILEYEMYENILEVCFSMSTVMERTPQTYKDMPEESIRDIFLAHLNGHFEGGVSGETFNKKGKTDILIQIENDVVFIAECKIWDGEKVLLDTIDQLFGYITWRDTKAAIFIFNKDRKITTVLNKIDDIMQKHNNFLSKSPLKSENLKKLGIYGYNFKHPDDENIKVSLTILVFNFNIPIS